MRLIPPSTQQLKPTRGAWIRQQNLCSSHINSDPDRGITAGKIKCKMAYLAKLVLHHNICCPWNPTPPPPSLTIATVNVQSSSSSKFNFSEQKQQLGRDGRIHD